LIFALLVVVEPAMLAAQSSVSYSPVTEQRLLNPEPHNWLMYRGTFNGWGYSPLEQITPANVKKLVPAWTFSTGVNEGHQAPPIDKNGYYFTLAPLVAKGKVMIGTSGGELGIRGYIAAFDARDGKPAWKTYTVPGPGEPGHDTWPGDTWKTGGVSVWLTAHYDPQLNL